MNDYPPIADTIRRPPTKDVVVAYVRIHGRVWRRRVEWYIETMYGTRRSTVYRSIWNLEQRGVLRYRDGVLEIV